MTRPIGLTRESLDRSCDRYDESLGEWQCPVCGGPVCRCDCPLPEEPEEEDE